MKKFIAVTALFLTGCFLLSACSAAAPNSAGATPPPAAAAAPSNTTGAPAPAAASSDATAAAPPYNGSMRTDSDAAAPAPTGFPIADEEYQPVSENAVKQVATDPLLTFSLKVDTASYSNVARYINSGSLPPTDAVRIEEMINYFNYDQPVTQIGDSPFGVYTEIGPSPFDAGKQIAFVRVKSEDIDRSVLPGCNLTFLIDTSGSMGTYDKLPLLKQSFSMLVNTLTAKDVISIVTYAGSSQIVLDSVSGDQKDLILSAINNLSAGGSTAGADGINTAYRLAEQNFMQGANNRVILATDGDFNVGVSSVDALEQLISQKRDSGVYLSVLGVGAENLKDNKMETLAKNGNGNYNYIDSADTAQKVLVDELSANLYTIADDVKAQIEFNPARVTDYRLIGYENSMLANQDFNNDQKDAGEIGIGTDVVLMFEITPVPDIPLKYQPATPAPEGDYSDELFDVKIRYKNPGDTVSQLITVPAKITDYSDFNSSDFNFAVSVAGFGELLRNSPYKGGITAARVLGLAKDSLGEDKGGYRKSFINLVEAYQKLV